MSKIMRVFYDNAGLPYKDSALSIHYPILEGGEFVGANNTTDIYFYTTNLGDYYYVANCKLPNGALVDKLLMVGSDQYGTYYALSLDSELTENKGHLKVALKGYGGDVAIEEETDGDTTIVVINGTPTIVATGIVDIAINYAPLVHHISSLTPSEYEELLAVIGTKLNILNGIYVIATTSDADLTREGQLYYVKATKDFYRVVSGVLTWENINYVAKSTQANIVYGRDDTQEIVIPIDDTVNGNVVRRNLQGNIYTPNPSGISDATPKQYVDKFAKSIQLSINTSTYVMTLLLKDKNGNTLSTQTVDLPLETMVVSGAYDNSTQSLVLTLQNGQTITIPIGDLVNGLASSADLAAVSEELEEVKQIALNASNTYFVNSSETVASVRNALQNNQYRKAYIVSFGTNGYLDNPANTYTDITNTILNTETYDNIIVQNPIFASTNTTIDLRDGISVDTFTKFLITYNNQEHGTSSAEKYYFIPISYASNTRIFRKGDLVVADAHFYPDRIAAGDSYLWSIHAQDIREWMPHLNVQRTNLVRDLFFNGSQLNDQIVAIVCDGTTVIGRVSLFSNGGMCTFAFDSIGSPDRFAGTSSTENLTFGDIFFTNTYRHVQEETSNKVTSLSSSSTDTQYPSAKAVYDVCQNIREVAEGKTKAFILRYADTIEYVKTNIGSNNHFYVFNSVTHEWEDKTTELLNGDYDNITINNSLFNSLNDSISAYNNIIFRSVGEKKQSTTNQTGDYYMADFITYAYNGSMTVGDVIYVLETSVPDRWISYVGSPVICNALETKADLSSYARKAYNETITGEWDFISGLDINGKKIGSSGSDITVAGELVPSGSHSLGSSSTKWQNIYLSGNLNFGGRVGNWVIPTVDHTYGLGNPADRWKYLYLSHCINPNTNYFGLAIPDTSAWTANKTIATTDQLETKANVDGNYPTMTVGMADNLTPYSENSGSDSTVPFLFRTTGGSADVGSTGLIRELRGQSYALNQLVDTNTTTITPTSGHKYLTRISGVDSIITSDGTTISVTGGTDQVIDLTVMFGAGKEPSTVAEFNRLFPLPYYAYNAGTMVNAQASKIIEIGFNQFDGEWQLGSLTNDALTTNCKSKNLIKVVPSQTYTFSVEITTNLYAYEYDANGNKINDIAPTYNAKIKTFTVGDNTHYIRVMLYDTGADFTNNFPQEGCVNLHWNGERDGEYEPYEKKEYALPNVELKSAGSAYDSIKPDGTLTRRIGSYTFTGEEIWNSATNDRWYWNGIASLVKIPSSGQVSGNLIGNIKYITIAADNVASNDLTIAINFNGSIILKDESVTQSSDLQTYFTGKTIYYELATSTETEVSTFSENLEVNDFGTEEFVSIYPQGVNIFYPVDYKAFIDSLGEIVDYDANALDPNKFAKKASNETITGSWTFSNGIEVSQNKSLKWTSVQYITGDSSAVKIRSDNAQVFVGESAGGLCPLPIGNYIPSLGGDNYKWKDLYLSGKAQLSNSSSVVYWSIQENSFGDLEILRSGNQVAYFNGSGFVPNGNGTKDLGGSSHRWNDGYFAGEVYAQNTFNVINASDIVSNTLTQAQYDLITNGKPTLIIGSITISNEQLENPFIAPMTIGSSNTFGAMFTTMINGRTWFYQLQINNTTKALSIGSYNAGNQIRIGGLEAVNGKYVPAYPSSTGTFVLKCVDGVLTWVAE